MNSLIFTALLAVFSTSTSVSAADFVASKADDRPTGCSCVLAKKSGTIGSISFASGDVFKSGAVGFRKASVGTKLTASTEVSTGDNGSAGISYGSDCSLSLGPNEIASVSSQGGGLCVGVASSGGISTGTGSGLGAAAIVGGAIAIGAGIAIANGGSDGGGAPASP